MLRSLPPAVLTFVATSIFALGLLNVAMIVKSGLHLVVG